MFDELASYPELEIQSVLNFGRLIHSRRFGFDINAARAIEQLDEAGYRVVLVPRDRPPEVNGSHRK